MLLHLGFGQLGSHCVGCRHHPSVPGDLLQVMFLTHPTPTHPPTHHSPTQYSSCLYERPDASLEDAEVAMLELCCQRAELEDGQQVCACRGTAWVAVAGRGG